MLQAAIDRYIEPAAAGDSSQRLHEHDNDSASGYFHPAGHDPACGFDEWHGDSASRRLEQHPAEVTVA